MTHIPMQIRRISGIIILLCTLARGGNSRTRKLLRKVHQSLFRRTLGRIITPEVRCYNAIFSPGQRIPSRSRRKRLLNSACACVRGVSKAHACRAGQEVPTDRACGGRNTSPRLLIFFHERRPHFAKFFNQIQINQNCKNYKNYRGFFQINLHYKTVSAIDCWKK